MCTPLECAHVYCIYLFSDVLDYGKVGFIDSVQVS
jgi:hypothetical protein